MRTIWIEHLKRDAWTHQYEKKTIIKDQHYLQVIESYHCMWARESQLYIELHIYHVSGVSGRVPYSCRAAYVMDIQQHVNTVCISLSYTTPYHLTSLICDPLYTDPCFIVIMKCQCILCKYFHLTVLHFIFIVFPNLIT